MDKKTKQLIEKVGMTTEERARVQECLDKLGLDAKADFRWHAGNMLSFWEDDAALELAERISEAGVPCEIEWVPDAASWETTATGYLRLLRTVRPKP